MSNPTNPNRVTREARLTWIPIPLMRINPLAQRDLNQARVDRLANTFDLEQLGCPTVNKRDGHYYIIDGHHRVRVLEAIGYGDQQVQCWTYEGLSESQEAEKFLQLNDVLVVNAYPKFKVAVQAGRERETDIDRIVRAQNLKVSLDKIDGAISAVGTLGRVYDRGGPGVLARSLRIIRDAYGDPGLEAPVIDGIGLLCGRYNGQLDDPVAIKQLSNVHAGVNGLLGKAEIIRQQTGNAKGHCVAAAAVDIVNRGLPRGKKLSPWFKDDA